MQRYGLETVDCSGTPREMGRAQGEALRERVGAFVAQRWRAALVYLRERGSRDLDALRAAGAACARVAEGWDAEGWQEHLGVAEGAGVDPLELYAAANLTDVRDVHLLADPAPAEAEGCTALVVPPGRARSGALIAAQTWDLNPTDLDYVVAVRRRPAEGPQTWSITCAGCPTLLGLNADGLFVGTTNIKVHGARAGVGYLSVLHRAIRCRSRAEAERVVDEAPRAAAHTYWLADADGATLLECSAARCVRRIADGEDLLCQTNHVLDPSHAALEGEPPTPSSLARLERARRLALAGEHDVDSLRALFADRADGVHSINRYPEDGQGTATNACAIAIPAKRELWACRGPSDRGEWRRLTFD